jgi:hypothetical protein
MGTWFLAPPKAGSSFRCGTANPINTKSSKLRPWIYFSQSNALKPLLFLSEFCSGLFLTKSLKPQKHRRSPKLFPVGCARLCL